MMMATALEDRLTPGKNFRPYDLDHEELDHEELVKNAKSPPSHPSSGQSPYGGPAAGEKEITPRKLEDLHQDNTSSRLQRDEEADNTDNDDDTENTDDNKTSRLNYNINENDAEENERDCLPVREDECLTRIDNGYETSPTDMIHLAKQHHRRSPHPSEPSLNYLKDMLNHKDRHLREQLFSNNNDLKHPYNPMCGTGANDINNTNMLATCLGRRSLQSLLDMTSSGLTKDDNLSGHDSDLDSIGDPMSQDYDDDDEDDDFESRDSKLDSSKPNSAFDLSMSQIDRVATNAEAKRARVEEIITSMRPVPSEFGYDSSNASLDRRQKRKQYQPQQHEARQDDDGPASPKRRRVEERGVLKEQLQHLQSQLQAVQKKYVQLYSDDTDHSLDNKDSNKHAKPEKPSNVIDWCPIRSPQLTPVSKECARINSSSVDAITEDKRSAQLTHSNSNNSNNRNIDNSNINNNSSSTTHSSKHSKKNQASLKSVVLSDDAMRDLGESLKTEITSAVEEAVQRVLKRCVRKPPTPKVQKEETLKIPVRHVTPPMDVKPMPFPRPELPMPFGDLLHSPLRPCDIPLTNHGISKLLESSPLRNCLDMHRNPLSALSPFPHLPYYIPGQLPPPPPIFPIPEPEQTEALSLVLSSPTPTKKKKVPTATLR